MNTNKLTSDPVVSFSFEEIQKLRELFHTLARTIKAAIQYPPHHPYPKEIHGEFYHRLCDLLENVPRITVTIEPDQLLWGEEVIHREGSNLENIAQILHRDGVRRLEISSAITREEVDSFVDAFVQCGRQREEAEDIVSLFWQADFKNIFYEVVDFLPSTEIGAELFLADNALLHTQDSPLEVLSVSLGGEEISEEDEQAKSALDIEPLFQKLTERFGDLDRFSVDELRALESLIGSDRRSDIRQQAIGLILSIFESEELTLEQPLVTDALQSVFDSCLKQGKFAILTEMVQQVKMQLQIRNFSSEKQKQRLIDFLSRAGDPIRFRLITEILNRDEETDLEPVRSFLNELGWETLRQLISMLGDLSHYPARKMACDLLLGKGIDKIEIIGNAVYDNKWYLVRNIVWVLGESGRENSLPFLERAATHSDIRVRGEVVKALGKLRGDRAIDLLLSLLSDENEIVRTMAANELGRSRSKRAFEKLGQTVKEKNFGNLPLSKRRKLLEALVLCGGEEAVGAVRNIIDRTTLLGRNRLKETQEAAVNALQCSDNSDAVVLLTQLATDPKSPFCLVAKKALAQLRLKQESKSDAEDE
jgi:HEAT repeat protein